MPLLTFNRIDIRLLISSFKGELIPMKQDLSFLNTAFYWAQKDVKVVSDKKTVIEYLPFSNILKKIAKDEGELTRRMLKLYELEDKPLPSSFSAMFRWSGEFHTKICTIHVIMQKLDLQVYNIDPTKINMELTPRNIVRLYFASIQDVLRLESMIFDSPDKKGYSIYYQYYYLKNRGVLTLEIHKAFEDVIRVIFPEENDFSKQCIDTYEVFAAALNLRIEEQYKNVQKYRQKKIEKITA